MNHAAAVHSLRPPVHCTRTAREPPMSDDKTEEPTEKRLRKAREDGEVSKSTDLVDGALLAAGVGMLMASGNRIVDALRSCVNISLTFVAGPHDMTTLLLVFEQIRSRTIGAVL